ncbi:MAG: hypothetical protein ABJC55_19620, partial [Algoriphagus sp.]
ESVRPTFIEQEVAEKPVASEKPKPNVEDKKVSNSWVWIAAILALGVVLVIIWQMNKEVVSGDTLEDLTTATLEKQTTQESSPAAINSTPAEETQAADDQLIISDSISSATPTPVPAQTGTTIASKVSGTLVRVTEKAEQAQFYIVVGSLPNEAMALEESEQYKNRAETVYLIMPYDDVTNYRLAIATSRGWTAINEELARVRDQYTEDLWILKY